MQKTKVIPDEDCFLFYWAEFSNVSKEMKDIMDSVESPLPIYEINLTDNPELGSVLDIKAVPTIINARTCQWVVGNISKEEIEKWLKKSFADL